MTRLCWRPCPISSKRIEVVVGDLTRLQVDAIVNAANTRLAGGGGVDGAIHRAAGERKLLDYNASQHPGGVATGLAVASPAFDLEARGIRRILHTAGPVWSDEPGKARMKLGDVREDVLLASCYSACLDLARDLGIESLAFPCIATGVFGFPRERAARIAFAHVLGDLMRHDAPSRVVFCCFSDEDAAVYRQAIATRDAWMTSGRRG